MPLPTRPKRYCNPIPLIGRTIHSRMWVLGEVYIRVSGWVRDRGGSRVRDRVRGCVRELGGDCVKDMGGLGQGVTTLQLWVCVKNKYITIMMIYPLLPKMGLRFR